MKTLAIVGCGNIGMRHLQSCMTLPADRYHIHVVEPSAGSRARAAEVVAAARGGPALSWFGDVSELPGAPDLAIVATRADIRAKLTLDLLDRTPPGAILFEKVLFQRLADFATVGDALEASATPAYVNCTRRCWPVYRALAGALETSSIERLSVTARGWDIGCNAIHFLDLFALLTGAADCRIGGCDLTAADPAKRPGVLHLEGRLEGDLAPSGGAPVPFAIESGPGDFDGFHVTIACAGGGRVDCREDGATVTVSVAGPAPVEPRDWPLPLQSQLTAGCVEDIVGAGRCDLPSYAQSRLLHEPMLEAFLAALAARGALAQPDLCPVT